MPTRQLFYSNLREKVLESTSNNDHSSGPKSIAPSISSIGNHSMTSVYSFQRVVTTDKKTSYQY